MPEVADLVEKMGEIGTQIQTVQEKTEALEKRYDGLDVIAIQENSQRAAASLEKIQKQMQEVKADEIYERLTNIESEIARGAAPTNEDKELREYRTEISRYLKRGIKLSPEMAENICRRNIMTSTIDADDEKISMLTRDLLTSVGPEAGYYILPDRSSMISKRIFESSPLRQLAMIVTTNSDEWEQILDDEEFEAKWVTETESRAKTDTSPIALIKCPVAELTANPFATQKMLDDSGFNLESWIVEKIGTAFGRKEANGFVVGDGAAKPKGFLAYDEWATPGVYERFKIETRESTGTANYLDNPDDLIQLQTDLLEAYQANAKWGMQRKTFAAVMVLKDAVDGQYLLDPMLLKKGAELTLLGAPVVFMADMPAVAGNAKAVIYADFMQLYTIVDRFGIRMLRNPYHTPPYVSFYTTKRVGGLVTNFQAGKILKIKSS